MDEITRVLTAIEHNDPEATEQLLPLVYDELRKMAARKLAGERPGHTLQPTALVHEAYLRLVGGDDARPWNGRRHFFGAAAEAMRRILVENARRKGQIKRGGGRRRAAADLDAIGALEGSPGEILDLHEALERFAREHPEKAKLVELRFFGGLTLEQAAECLGISPSTADRSWRYARAWLYDAMSENDTHRSSEE